MPFKYGNLIVGSFELADGAVTTPKLADAAVTTLKIDDGAVTTPKVDAAAITNAKVALDAIDTANIVDDAIEQAKIALAAVGTDEIAALAVTAAKIAALAVGTAQIDNAAITNAKIANLAVDNAKIANLAASKLLAGAIAVSEFITSSNYVAGSDGWAIDGDGNAEFNDVTVRGTVDGSTVQGSTIVSDDVADDERVKIVDGQILFLDITGGTEADYAAITPQVGINAIRFQAANSAGVGGRLLLAERGTGGETSLRSFDGDVRIGSDTGGEVLITSLGTPGIVNILAGDEIIIGNNTLDLTIVTGDYFRISESPSGQVFFFIETAAGEEAISVEDNKIANGRMLIRTSHSGAGGSPGLKFSRNATAANALLESRNAADTAYRAMAASAFPVSSDRRVKDNIRDIPAADLERLATLRAHTYEREGITEIGFIADELPDSVVLTNDDGEKLYNLPGLVALMWEELVRLRDASP